MVAKELEAAFFVFTSGDQSDSHAIWHTQNHNSSVLEITRVLFSWH